MESGAGRRGKVQEKKMAKSPLNYEGYWRQLASNTRVEAGSQLVLTAVLLTQIRNGGERSLTVNGTESFRRLTVKTCPWLADLPWSLSVPQEKIEIHMSLEASTTPKMLLGGFLRVYARDFLRKSAIRAELVESVAPWLTEGEPDDVFWVVGEDRAFVAAARWALSRGRGRFATPSTKLALIFESLKAFDLDVETEIIRGGDLRLGRFNAPVITVPEPNTDSGRAPIGRFQLDELSYAEAALDNTHRIVAIVSGGSLFRTQGEDLELKAIYLHSRRLARVAAFPSAAGVESGIETIGLLFCDVTGKPLTDVELIDFPRLQFSRRPWPVKLRTAFTDTLLTGRSGGEGIEAVSAHAAALLEEKCIFTVGSRIETQGDREIDELLSRRGARPLTAFVEVIRCHALGTAVDGGDGSMREATPNDITECGFLRRPKKSIQPDFEDKVQVRRMQKQSLCPGDILLTQRGRVGSLALVEDIPAGEIWMAGQLFVILRLRTESPVHSAKYLLRYLQCRPVQERLQRISSNTAVPQIRAEDLENLLVPLPDPELGVRPAEESYNRARELSDKIEKMREEIIRTAESMEF